MRGEGVRAKGKWSGERGGVREEGRGGEGEG